MSPHKRVWQRYIFILSLLMLMLPACSPDPCSAAFLILEINNANATPATTDTINLVAGCTYELATIDNTIDGNNGLPSITSPIVINGNDATIRRSPTSGKMPIRLFHIAANGDLTLNRVTLFDGIAIEPTDVTILVSNSGGAIYNAGRVAVNNSIIKDNHAKLKGGGIYNASMGSLFINATTIQYNGANIGNVPGEIGGGVYNEGEAEIVDSTIAGNKASQSGAGIGNSGHMRIFNSTISGNATSLAGIVNGPAIVNSGTVEISYTTITDNYGSSTPGGEAVFSVLDTITFENSIVAMNPLGDCSIPAASIIGANLDSDGSCHGFTITADPKLDPLADNGGPTYTHALQPDSPAIDAALGSCPPADQRGKIRPQGPACDIGAYEASPGPLPAPSDTPTPVPTPTPPPTSTPTPTVTYTPTPLICSYEALENVNCRESDYVESSLFAILMKGEVARLVALNPEYTHGRFELASGEQCWIWLGLMGGEENPFGVCGVPVVDPPPPPTKTPTPVCSPNMTKDACIASGGTWNEGAAAAGCTCP